MYSLSLDGLILILPLSLHIFFSFLFTTLPFPFPPYYSSATNRLITPKDHAAIQLNIGEVDAEGRYTGKSVAFALSGAVRFSSEADNSMCRLATEQGFLKSVFSAQH